MPASAIEPVSFTLYSKDFDRFARELGASFERYGFAVLSDYDLPQDRIDAAVDDAKAFFALPVDIKKQYAGIKGGARGYIPFGVETAKGATHHDLKEFWHMGRDLPPGHRFRANMADNVWPAEVPAFKHDVSWLYNALDGMGGKVLEAIATYLKLDRDFFKPTVENGNSVLRLLHYPPIPVDATGVRAPQSEAILVQKGSPIQSVKELAGKKVALNKGSNVHYLLVRALEEAGLKYSDIQPVYLPPADARAAFERGSVDAWVIWDPFQAAAEKQLEARTLRNGEGLVDNHQFYLATRTYAQKHPQVVSTLIEEVRAVGEDSKADPDKVTEQVAPLLGLSKEITSIAVKRQGYGAQPLSPEVVAAQQKIADTFTGLKLIPKKLSIADVIWTPPAKVAQQ